MQILSIHWVDEEDNLKKEKNHQNEDDLKIRDNLKN